jgi:Homeodomain-like domain
VSRSKSTELADRNQRIVEMIAEGYSGQVIADNFGITRQRVSQIVQEHQEAVTDDAYRDVMRTQAEGVLDELFRIFRGPGKRMVSPGGKIICENNPDGTPDFSRPVYDEYAKVDVANAIIKLQERLGRSYGLDRVRQRERDQSEEMGEFMTWVAELDAQNKALKAQLANSAETSPPEILQAEIVEEAS